MKSLALLLLLMRQLIKQQQFRLVWRCSHYYLPSLNEQVSAAKPTGKNLCAKECVTVWNNISRCSNQIYLFSSWDHGSGCWSREWTARKRREGECNDKTNSHTNYHQTTYHTHLFSGVVNSSSSSRHNMIIMILVVVVFRNNNNNQPGRFIVHSTFITWAKRDDKRGRMKDYGLHHQKKNNAQRLLHTE